MCLFVCGQFSLHLSCIAWLIWHEIWMISFLVWQLVVWLLIYWCCTSTMLLFFASNLFLVFWVFWGFFSWILSIQPCQTLLSGVSTYVCLAGVISFFLAIVIPEFHGGRPIWNGCTHSTSSCERKRIKHIGQSVLSVFVTIGNERERKKRLHTHRHTKQKGLNLDWIGELQYYLECSAETCLLIVFVFFSFFRVSTQQWVEVASVLAVALCPDPSTRTRHTTTASMLHRRMVVTVTAPGPVGFSPSDLTDKDSGNSVRGARCRSAEMDGSTQSR